MSYRILASGYRKTIALLSFEASSAKLKVVSESPAPQNASWIEASAVQPKKEFYATSRLFAVSEEPVPGRAVSLAMEGDDLKITSERSTHGGPAHIHCMKDGSGIIASNYAGGTILFFPIESDGQLSATSPSPNLEFPFPYKTEKAPNPERQDTPHPHQAIEGANQTVYVPDLGSDRIWVVKRKGADALAIHGYLQCPGGSGPRHCVISDDGKHLYVLTEMHHSLLVFSLDNPSYPANPLPDFEASIVPPSVPATHSKYMDSAELVSNPTVPHVLYASNRWELHIKEKNKDLPDLPGGVPKGDSVAIVLLSKAGDKIEEIKHVRTECDAIRGMSVSPDGKYVALAGQEGGGVEIWAVSGERGDQWKLAAKKEDVQQVVDLIWI